MLVDINGFIAKLEIEFEDIAPGTLLPSTNLRELDIWDSMHALILIALVDIEYDVTITADEIAGVGTIQDIFNIVLEKYGTD